MSFEIRDADTEVLVRQLASHLGVSLPEAIRTAVRNELTRLEATRGDKHAPAPTTSAKPEPPAEDKNAFTELNEDG
jgi:hypothetical protein